MSCFQEDGAQVRQIPRPVLQALAKCFIEFKSGRSDPDGWGYLGH
jgi:hypothetical protein